MNPGPQERAEAICIVSDWVFQVKEEIKKKKTKQTNNDTLRCEKHEEYI